MGEKTGRLGGHPRTERERPFATLQVRQLGFEGRDRRVHPVAGVQAPLHPSRDDVEHVPRAREPEHRVLVERGVEGALRISDVARVHTAGGQTELGGVAHQISMGKGTALSTTGATRQFIGTVVGPVLALQAQNQRRIKDPSKATLATSRRDPRTAARSRVLPPSTMTVLSVTAGTPASADKHTLGPQQSPR
jgi:hypothetical protein